jgi:SPP1 family predicted phage head-tail adaptor
MEAGKLDRLVTLERATVVDDPFGGEVETWAPLATVPAEMLPISDGERFRYGEVAAEITTRWRIRWGYDVTAEDRLTYEGRVFAIVGVKEIGRHEGQELTTGARAE